MARTCEITYKMVIDFWERTKADVPEDPEQVLFCFCVTLEPMKTSMRIKYEPSSEPLHSSAR